MIYLPNAKEEKNEIKKELWGSLLKYTQLFYKLYTNREFTISRPVGRESHTIIISRTLTKVTQGLLPRVVINVPPRSGKSTDVVFWITWVLSQFPDSNFSYVSISMDLALTKTRMIKDIMSLPYYEELFGVRVNPKISKGKSFETNYGGKIFAAGLDSTIVGLDVGIPLQERPTGALIIDDAHKPGEILSEPVRRHSIEIYNTTLKTRVPNMKIPIVFIGQRVHEDDLAGFLLKGGDGQKWEHIKIKALDDAGNSFDPDLYPAERLEIEKKVNDFVFWSQMQQEPIPVGGSIFKKEDFLFIDKFPENIEFTFITCDTAETAKTFNDKTVFSLWGVHKIIQNNIETDVYGLVWIDCMEIAVEPCDLEKYFWSFYSSACTFRIKRSPCPPVAACIEKASTGVTLLSVLGKVQGLIVLPIVHKQNSKVTRFLAMQPFIKKKLISIHKYAKHAEMCIEHMIRITLTNSHSHDDIADTLEMAIDSALVNKIVQGFNWNNNKRTDELAEKLSNRLRLDKGFSNIEKF